MPLLAQVWVALLDIIFPPALALWLPVAVGVWGLRVEGCSPLEWGGDRLEDT